MPFHFSSATTLAVPYLICYGHFLLATPEFNQQNHAGGSSLTVTPSRLTLQGSLATMPSCRAYYKITKGSISTWQLISNRLRRQGQLTHASK